MKDKKNSIPLLHGLPADCCDSSKVRFLFFILE